MSVVGYSIHVCCIGRFHFLIGYFISLCVSIPVCSVYVYSNVSCNNIALWFNLGLLLFLWISSLFQGLVRVLLLSTHLVSFQYWTLIYMFSALLQWWVRRSSRGPRKHPHPQLIITWCCKAVLLLWFILIITVRLFSVWLFIRFASAGKELSFWLSACTVLYLILVLCVCVPFPCVVLGRIWCGGIRLIGSWS